jgi:hypothetical protein
VVIAFLGLSDTGEGALIAVGGGIATLVVSQLFSRVQWIDERRSRLAERQAEIDARQKEQQAERMEWYRRLLFERRLQAATEAYGWAMEINRLVNVASSKPRDEALAELRETVKGARAWYDSNAVYLNDGLPTSSNFIGVINSAADVLRGDRFDWKCFNDFLDELRERTQELLAPVRE